MTRQEIVHVIVFHCDIEIKIQNVQLHTLLKFDLETFFIQINLK